MIEFKHKLPCIWASTEKMNGTYNNYEFVLPSVLTTKDAQLGLFCHALQNSVRDDRRLVFVDGRVLKCSNNWIRDHVHQMKAFKHWEYDLKSFLQFIIDIQRDDGQYYELVKQLDDGHHTYVNADCNILYPDDSVAATRLEVEADVEYLVVEGVLQYYRATGDIDWVKSVLPKLEKGINYVTSDAKRWDSQHGLVKRPFTIDTWDFIDNARTKLDRSIHDDENMSIMHGDNSGVFMAMNILAFFHQKLGNEQQAKEWIVRAEQIKENMFKYLWNGKFFIHQLHLNHNGIDDKENIRLSLSNGYDINRGVTTVEQSRSIIDEYQQRRKTTTAFAEWFSINPPYPSFHSYQSGEYVNGAISPFTAGELARAAFENGYENYGYDIIKRFIKMLERDGNIYFLYNPSTQLPQGGGPSAWGSAALLNAIDEGLAGITDGDCLYQTINFSPRFVVTEYEELRYVTGYEVSNVFVDVRFVVNEQGMRYDVVSQAKRINAHILLPQGKSCQTLFVNDKKQQFAISSVGNSNYVDFSIDATSNTKIEIIF